MGSRTPLAGAFRSSLVAGWGQWTQGRRFLGVALLASVVAPLVALAWSVVARPTTAASWLLRPDALLVLLLLNVLLWGLRTWGVWDAWAGTGGRSRGVWLVTLLVFTALPHVGVGWLQVRTIGALQTVFAVPSARPLPNAVTSPTTVQPARSIPASTGVPTTGQPATTVTSGPIATTQPSAPWGDNLTILLLGGDGGAGRSGIRTDVMMVMNVNTTTGDLSLFSLPRNLRGFPFDEVPGFTGILNEVYQVGEGLPEVFGGPDPGAAAVLSVAQQITGLEIDHFAMIDFYAFVAVVNTLGGVTLTVPHEITYPEYRLEDGSYISITLEPGLRELDGDEALAFVRSRKSGSDYGRMERQRCVISALIAQADLPSLIVGLPGLITTFEDRVTTDIPLDSLPGMLEMMIHTDIEHASVVTFGPPLWHRGWIEGGWPVPDVDKIQRAVGRLLEGDASVLGDPTITSAGAVCGLPGA